MPATATWSSARRRLWRHGSTAPPSICHRRRPASRASCSRASGRTTMPAARSPSAGDVNGDGFDDLIVGARWRRRPRLRRHAPMPATATWSSARRAAFGRRHRPAPIIAGRHRRLRASTGERTATIRSGFSVASAGDVNGDGFDDLIVGAPSATARHRAGGRNACRRQLRGLRQGGRLRAPPIDLAPSPRDGSRRLRDPGRADAIDVRPLGRLGGRRQRRRLRRPDRRGARVPTAPRRTHYAGDSYVIFGKAGGLRRHHRPRGHLDGRHRAASCSRASDAGDQSGCSVSSAGDVNGDGFDDLIVGAPGAPGRPQLAGDSYVVFGKAGGFRRGDRPRVPQPRQAAASSSRAKAATSPASRSPRRATSTATASTT